MTTDTSIFGLRFGSNEDLAPTPAELKAFLRSPKREGRREKHEQDLAAYDALLEQVSSFELRERIGVDRGSLAEWMYYGVLSHTRYFNTGFKSAVEQFKYHMQAMRTMDFRKPAAFIRIAEEEIAGLNPKRKRDAEKLARLQNMVSERRAALDALSRKRRALGNELRSIAVYIRDNLARIAAVCEAAATVLADPKVAGSEKGWAIEDIKAQFKEELRGALHEGRITKADLEAAKRDVDRLSAEVSAVLRDDISALRSLYEAVLNLARKAVRNIDSELAGTRSLSFDDERDRFARIEQVLVSAVQDHGLDLPAREVRSETRHQKILTEKRQDMLDHVFDLLHKERRKRFDRRSGRERRKSAVAADKELKRRSGRERRSGKARRR